MAAGTHDGADLVHDVVGDFAAAAGVDVDIHALVSAVLLEEGLKGDGDPVVHAGTEHFALGFADANDGVGRAADADLLAERVAGAEDVVNDVGTDDGDVGAVLVLNLSEGAAKLNVEVGDGGHGPGVAADVSAGARVVAEDDGALGAAAGAYGDAGAAFINNGAVIVVGDVAAFLEGEVLVDGDEGLRHLADADDASAVGVDF